MKKIIFITVMALSLGCLFAAVPAFTENNGPEPLSLPRTGGRLYGIGSVSKVFTASAVMKLADEGKVNLDEPLTAYIPEFAMADERYRQITPRMLLNHSSGLMGMTDNNAFLIGDNDTYLHDHFLEYLKSQTLKHDPGDRSIYSNDSFTLAEILVEHVGGMTFTDYLERNFLTPMGLENIKTPQSDFHRGLLAETYLGNNELKAQSLGVIGSGGIYADMEDLCRFAGIFMNSADGSVLSAWAVDEMAKNQHKMEIVAPDADTVFRYGLGWDSVTQYPFSQMGIRALSKGGATGLYHTNLTVLPEHNLAAAVASSGDGGLEMLVAQEIILAVLEEEGLIPESRMPALPRQNPEYAPVPEDLLSRAGVYDAGMAGLYGLSFTADALILTPLGVRNERPMEFLYTVDGSFLSTSGNVIGFQIFEPGASGTLGVTTLRFQGKYLVIQTYEEIMGLSQSAEALPFAEKIEANPVSQPAQAAWAARNEREYLLISEKHTSARYITAALSKTMADPRFPGHVIQGVYRGAGNSFSPVRIVDEHTARGAQNIPTMMGRDTVNLAVTEHNGAECLRINNHRYITAASAIPFAELGGEVIIGPDGETLWMDVASDWGGKITNIQSPANGSWFVYDDRMNCIATSLEKNPRKAIVLPEGGRLAFAGEAGATFTVQ
ncbi:MAG: beta-lactamase family protein [Clostridia bacterium]|nr:beta-lactamase family protein [Clostridia bacterium]